MRLIGTLSTEEQARGFSDYLTHKHIENQLAIEPDGTCEIWVISENDLEQAETLFEEFLANPDDGKYRDAAKAAKRIKREQNRERRQKDTVVDVRTTVFNRGGMAQRGKLTVVLIAISVVVALLTKLGENTEALKPLLITNVRIDGNMVRWFKGLPEISNGQFWRLLTPIFIHFGPLHLIFNMMWLYDLGNMIENRKGTLFLGIFVALTGIGGNIAQFLVSSPLFGGMSGVVYGMLGYIWMKGKYDPNSRLYLHKSTVTFMLIWFFLCFTPLIGNIANGAHTAGLVLGVIWGYVTTPRFKRLFR